MAASNERKNLHDRALPPDLDATRLKGSSGKYQKPAAQADEDYPTRVAAPAAMPAAYSSSAYPESVYPEPPRQPMMSPPPAAYSPFPGYQNPAGDAASQADNSQRSWGIVALTTLLVLTLIGLAIGATWIFASKGGDKKDAAASQSQTASTRTATVLETTVTTTQTPRQAPTRVPAKSGKPIPENAVEIFRGFVTPTGNIYCSMFDSPVFCRINERQWELGCNDSWTMKFTPNGIEQSCEDDGWVGGIIEASYDTVYYNGDYACEVGAYTGVNCWNSKTGHGFTMRKADHSTY